MSIDFIDKRRQELGLEPIMAPIFERAEARNRVIPSETVPVLKLSSVSPVIQGGIVGTPVLHQNSTANMATSEPSYTPIDATPPISAEQSQKGAELLRKSIKEKLSDGSQESEQYLSSVGRVYGDNDRPIYAFVEDNTPLKREIAQEINRERAENATKATQDSLWAGLTALNSSLVGPFKAVTDAIGWKEGSDFFQNYYIDVNNEAQEHVQENIDKGLTNEYVDAFTQGTVGAIPSAAMAYLSGGSSLVSQATTATGTAATGLSAQVLNASKQLLSNPNFHFSMIQSFGGSYNQAKESGASTDQAILSAIYSSVPQSIIEISGGTEKLMSKIAAKIGNKPSRDVVQSALEEALEEVVQYPFEGVAQKATYNPDIPVFSTTENAIINPTDIIKNAAVGGSVGALLGGGGELINSYVNSRPVQLPDGSTVYVDQNNNPVSAPQNTSLENTETVPQINQNASANVAEAGRTAKSKTVADLSLFDSKILKNLNQARKNLISYAQSHFPKTVTNQQTGMKIDISRTGIDKLLSGNISKEKYASAFHVPELINNAIQVGEAPNLKGKEGINTYYYFDSPIEISGNDYTAHIRVRSTDMGNKYYGHTLSGVVDEIKIEPSARNSVAETTLHPVNTIGSTTIIPNSSQNSNSSNVAFLHKVINKIDLTPLSEVLAGTAPVANGNSAGLSTPIIPGFSQKINQNAQPKPVARTRESDGEAVTWYETEKDTVSNASRAFEEKYRIKTKVARPSKKTKVSAFLQDGEIVLNADTLNTYSGTVGKIAHEATHIIEGTDAWEGAKEAALAYYETIDPNITIEDLKQWKAEEYRDLTDLDSTQQVQEVVAGFLEDICSRNDLIGERAARILAQENPKGFRRITQYFKDKIQMLKTYIPIGTGLTEQQRLELRATQRGLDNLEKGLNAYRKGKTQTSQGTQYSINPDFAKKYDQWDKKKTGFQFLIGTTSKPLQSIGINEKSIYWDASKILKIKEKHPAMTDDVIKQVPNILENPILIMDSKTQPGRITLFGDIYDSKGVPVLSILELNPTDRGGHSLDIIKVASAYGKDSNPQGLINSSKILYIEPNKNRTNRWLSVNRLQLPLPSSSIDSNTNVPQKANSVNNSISKTSKNDTSYSYGDSSVASLMEFMNRKYGTIPEGENAYRKVAVPRRTSEGTKTRQGIRTILEAKSTPDQMAEALKQQVVEDAYAYVPVSDKNAEMQAEKTIRDRGQKGALERWNAVVNGTELANKETLALAEKLMVEAGKRGDVELFQKLAAEISAEATRAGQTVQAMRLIKKMTPEGQLYYLQKSLDSMQKDLKRRFKNKDPKLEISEELKKELLNAKNLEEMDAVEQKIFVEIANQIPSTWMDKWDSWRYLAMLANPRTHIRNVLGNTVFVPARLLKNAVAMGIEHIRVGNHQLVKPENRTASILAKSDKPLLEFAEKDFETVKESLTSSGKMNPSNRINELRKIYKPRWLETLRKANNKALDAEDMFFLKRAYTHSMARMIKARKLDLDFLTSGSREANIQLKKIQALATQEALEATYRDASAIANALNRFKSSNPAANVFGNALFAFTKTPINVLKRGIEYSPAGVIKGVVDGISMVRSGKKTATDVVSDFSKSLSGVGISLFGYWLASMGLLSAGAPEDDKEKGFETLQGAKNYALKIGDTYYTIDWMAPVALPLFVGAELHNALEGEGFDLAAVVDSLTKVSEPMFNLSMLDGINSAFKKIAYSEGNYLTDFATEAALDYISQALPTLGGQIARTIDPTVRDSYYIDKTSVIPEGVQTLLNTIQSKIPGFSYLLAPKVDQWGRTTNKENVVLRAFENFISPGYISTRKETPVDKELAEIYEETGEKRVLPSHADESFKVDGETYRLSSKEYTEYAQSKGQLSFKLINELLSNSDYQKLDVDEKVEIIRQMYQVANAEAKKEVNSDYDIPNTVIKAYEANKQAGILYGEYYLWKMSLDSTPNMQEVIDALNRTNLTKSQKKFLFAQRFPQSNNNPFN